MKLWKNSQPANRCVAKCGKRSKALSCHLTQLIFFEWWIKDTAEVFIQTVPFGACCLKENGKLQVAKTADVGESQRNQ